MADSDLCTSVGVDAHASGRKPVPRPREVRPDDIETRTVIKPGGCAALAQRVKNGNPG